MTAEWIAVCTLLSISACSSHDAARNTGSGSAAGSNVHTQQPSRPHEDMITVSAGTYTASDPVFAPDGSGACSAETFSKVRELAAKEGWPDRAQDVSAYLIDRDVVSCSDYEACAAAGKCPTVDHWDLCTPSGARVTVEQAVAYCGWRSAKLPTLLQWQAAVRGPSGKSEAVCEENLDKSKCTFKAENGVTVHPWGGAKTEFTSTMACWHDDHGTGGKVRRLDASPLPKQLYLFVPDDDDEHPDKEWFRCVRQPVAASNP